MVQEEQERVNINIVIMEKAIILTLSLATLTSYRYYTLLIPTYTVHVKLAINNATEPLALVSKLKRTNQWKQQKY